MVTIGITTYNRKNIVEIMAKSLYKSDLTVPHAIRIYDDCSTEYGRDFLEKLFPTAASIKINPVNLRADKNMYQMYADFITTGDEYFFNADSDVIFTNQWLNKAINLIEKTDGIVSLFNSNTHKQYKIVDDALCLKNTVGAAGVFFSRNCVVKLLTHFNTIEQVKSFDWQFSEFFTNNGVKIYCVNKSLIQHIGYDGQHSKLYFDIGKNYTIETVGDGQIINDIFENSMDNTMVKAEETAAVHEKRINSFGYCFKRCIIIFIKNIMPKVLYNKIKSRLLKSRK
ncbi:MAG: glycosyltransferase, partial [Spirochaetaceae bacterium]|nr:glycosyltransferase [Spirochaetaceae bacterium]